MLGVNDRCHIWKDIYWIEADSWPQQVKSIIIHTGFIATYHVHLIYNSIVHYYFRDGFIVSRNLAL